MGTNGTMLAFLAAAAVALPGAASAQSGPFGGAPTGVPLPMPSPMDAMRGDIPPRIGACGLDEGWNGLRLDMQAAYEKAGRCEAYDPGLWDAYARNKPRYQATFAGYFAAYDLDWWDGTVPSSQVRREAEIREDYERWLVRPCASKKCGREKAAAREAYISWHSPAAARPAAAPPPPPAQEPPAAAANSEVGACGVPLSTGLTAEAQTEADRIGTCDQIRQVFGG